jgi:N-acetylglucosamine kinase-like BadF-type ATPase
MMTPLFIGVDGGGSHTRAVVAGEDLVPRGRGSAGPANAATRPLRHVVAAVADAVAGAAHAAGIEPGSATGIACGLAGVETAGVADGVAKALEAIYASRRVLVTTDAKIALAGAVAGPVDGPGVVLIAGTGAIAFGRGMDGTEARAGGWGPVIGDEGSGYAIAREGLAAVVRDLDGRGERTKIRDLLFASEKVATPDELLHRIHGADGGPSDVAAYFPLVIAAAKEGDPQALRILAGAAEELSLAAATVIRKLHLEEETVDVATVGGVFSAGELVLHPLREKILAIAPRARLHPPVYPPEIGAIRLALAAVRSSP